MKSLTVLFLVALSLYTYAQDCKSYYFLQNNKTIELTITDKKGKPGGKLMYTVSNVNQNGPTATATVNSSVIDSKGNTSAKGETEMKCTGGVLMMDMKMSIPQQQAEQFGKGEAKAENAYMEYSANMKVGDALKDGSLLMELNNSGMMQTLSYKVNDRKVEAKESITTPAGTWDCYRITYKGKLNVKMLVGINFNMDGTEWYAPGFGLVKTQTRLGGTEVTSIK